MSSFLVKVFLLIIFLAFFFVYSIPVYRLVSKAYFIDETQLYRVDTFHLYNRAFVMSDGANKHKQKLTFYATNGYSFSIRGNAFESIKNRQQLKDILLCDDDNFVANTTLNHDIAFIVYTTKKEFGRYKSTAYPTSIAVYQLQIGNTKYIDINRLNDLNRSSLKAKMILPAFFAGIVILIFAIKPIRKRIFADT